ncbi:MAG: AraC family transcriptional regulator, partial [Hyphomicrobiales bacterium]
MTRRVAFVVFSGFQILDATGPIAVFDLAARFVPEAYAIEIMAIGGGLVQSSSGLAVLTTALSHGPFDTIVLVGGGLRGDFAEVGPIVEWVGREARQARRITSVCSGAYFLAQAGLLDGRRATTHWSACNVFAKQYPAVRLEPDRIYIQDGPVWTSGGITA